jgi:alpha-D-ribose 1-methylphosphonate 5-triphosphate synthase subunit PhnL
MTHVLSVHRLKKSYTRHLFDGQRLDVLRGIDLELAPGTFTVLTGPSGSGKSSLLRCIYRSAVVDDGSIVFHANGAAIDLLGASDRAILDLRRTHIGLATQLLSVVPRVGALDLLCETGLERSKGAQLLETIGLSQAHFDVPPATFSGGERQMLNLALVLARWRPLLLLDEVTASLDRRRKRTAYEALLGRKHSGVTMLAVSHEIPDLPGLVDRVVTMRDGLVVEPNGE